MLWLLGLASAAPTADIEAVLDTLHRSAAAADADQYFGLFAPDAVFIGTDPEERWDLEAFRAFAAPHFEEAPAWAYTSVERHVEVRKRVAWFDEVLEHDRYGRVRGSGVLVKQGKEWRVSQYVLSFAVPNDVAMHVIDVVEGEAVLPAPFTAAQIRDAMPVGARLRHRVRDEGGEQITTWRVLAADDASVTIEYGSETMEAAEPRSATHTWEELREHAAFTAGSTRWEEVRLDTPVGPLDCRRYTVNEGDTERVFWFAHAVPGAPVRAVVSQAGQVVSEMELVERVLPEPR